MSSLKQSNIEDKIYLKSGFCDMVRYKREKIDESIASVSSEVDRIILNDLIKQDLTLEIESIGKNPVEDRISFNFVVDKNGNGEIVCGDKKICDVPGTDILEDKNMLREYLIKRINKYLVTIGKHFESINVL